MAARPSSACSMSLPDRIAIGRSGESSRSSSAAAMARTLANACRIGQRAPGAGAVALRQENAVGRGLRPMGQPLGEFFRIGRQWLRRAQQDRAVGSALDHRRSAGPSRTGRSGAVLPIDFLPAQSTCDQTCYPRTTLGPRFSRNAFSRFFASSSPWAIAAVSASVAKPAAGSLRGDARQHVRDGEIGERRIAGDALGEFDRFGQAVAVIDEILRQPDRLAFFGIERAPGQHHVHHAGDADQRRQPHRAAAADKNAAARLPASA